MHKLILSAVFALSSLVASSLLAADTSGNVQSLAGEWRFKLDAGKKGVQERWFSQSLAEKIQLPGTTDEAKFGTPSTQSDNGQLTRLTPTPVQPSHLCRQRRLPAEDRRNPRVAQE